MTIVTIITIAYTIEAGAMKANTWTVAAATPPAYSTAHLPASP